MTPFRCRYCGRFFRPNPRKRKGSNKQKVCGHDPCRLEHRKRKYQDWAKRNPDYRKGEAQRNKTKAWAKVYPDYWRRYRAEHSLYSKRERRRMRLKRWAVRRVAKQTVIREILVEKLRAVDRIGVETVAKQTVISRRMKALVEALIWKESVAKQTSIDRAGRAKR